LLYCVGLSKLGWLEIKMNTSASVYADDVNMLGRTVHNKQENAEASVLASKEIGVEINVDKSRCMVMFEIITQRAITL
jgi:hypothetical protein